jgi:hypothetical protein
MLTIGLNSQPPKAPSTQRFQPLPISFPRQKAGNTVSGAHGGVDAVIDAETNKLIVNTPRGGGASKILMAALESNELVSIGPAAMEIAGRDKCRALRFLTHRP